LNEDKVSSVKLISNLAKEMNLAFEVSLFIFQSDLLCAVKSYNMGLTALLSLKERHAVDFCCP
jgi:hypothetical protein